MSLINSSAVTFYNFTESDDCNSTCAFSSHKSSFEVICEIFSSFDSKCKTISAILKEKTILLKISV